MKAPSNEATGKGWSYREGKKLQRKESEARVKNKRNDYFDALQVYFWGFLGQNPQNYFGKYFTFSISGSAQMYLQDPCRVDGTEDYELYVIFP